MSFEFLSKSIVLDTNTLSQLLGHDTSMIKRFIHLFLAESPKIVNQIDEAMHNEDLEGVLNGVHTLKGQLKYFGLSEQIKRLECIEAAASTCINCAEFAEQWMLFTTEFSEVYQQIKAL